MILNPRRYFRAHVELLEDRRLMHADHDHSAAKVLAEEFSQPAALAEVAAVQAAAVSADPAISGSWKAVASWNQEAVNAVMLRTGKVMVWNYTGDSVFLWDPVTDKYTIPAQPGWNIFCAGQSLLPDGRLFVAGGHVAGAAPGTQPGDGAPDAGIYDPIADTWTKLPNMNRGRWYPEVVTLGDGNVLVLAGHTGYDGFGANGVPQLWNFATNSWKTYTQAKLTDFQYPRAFQAPNGMVFEAGPGSISRYFDPTGIGRWTVVTNTLDGNRLKGTAVMYANGKVMITGGASDNPNPPMATTEVINLNQASPVWRRVDSMEFARKNFNVTIMADGKLLAVGGTTGTGTNNKDLPVMPAEIWDAKTEQWTTVASSLQPHWYHSTSLLLPDGRVLVMGGVDTLKAEIYSPPYLFKGARPTIDSAPTVLNFGQNFNLRTPNAADIASVHLVRFGSATHAFNFDQGVESLSFSRRADGVSLRVTAPADGNQAVPGYYMMFIVNSAGVPSVSQMIRLRPKPVSSSQETISVLAMDQVLTPAPSNAAASPLNATASSSATLSSATLRQKSAEGLIGPIEAADPQIRAGVASAIDFNAELVNSLRQFRARLARGQVSDVTLATDDLLSADDTQVTALITES